MFLKSGWFVHWQVGREGCPARARDCNVDLVGAHLAGPLWAVELWAGHPSDPSPTIWQLVQEGEE